MDIGAQVFEGEFYSEYARPVTVPIHTVLRISPENFLVSDPGEGHRVRRGIAGSVVLCGFLGTTHTLNVGQTYDEVTTRLVELGWGNPG